MAQRDYGQDIRNRLPEKSPLQTPGNPGRVMIDSAIGVEFANIEEAIFANAYGRSLLYAEGIYLDLFGDWFGIRRDGRTDEEYRNILKVIRTVDCTIHGVKTALAALLGIPISSITITNTYNLSESNPEERHTNYFDFGDVISAERPSENPRQKWRGHNTAISTKMMTIQVPTGSDVSMIEEFIPRVTLPNVQVTIVEV